MPVDTTPTHGNVRGAHIHPATNVSGAVPTVWPIPWPDRWFVGWAGAVQDRGGRGPLSFDGWRRGWGPRRLAATVDPAPWFADQAVSTRLRSEEHTSELQSLRHL